uniref:Uncharacterized protein n=1 Tax=Oryza rufipogon TaxID=4529 RepID=A0A0E0NEJ9_ORYRU
MSIPGDGEVIFDVDTDEESDMFYDQGDGEVIFDVDTDEESDMFYDQALSSMINSGDMPSISLSPLLDHNEQRRQKDRERYAQMTNEDKENKLKRRREAYKRKKIEDSYCISIQEKRARARVKYNSMEPEQKQAKIAQVNANRAARRNTPSEDSIALENPGYIASDMPPPLLTRPHRKPVTHGERHALIARRNESFMIRRDTRTCDSLEDPSISVQTTSDIDPPKQPSIQNTGENAIYKHLLHVLMQYIFLL